MSFLKIQIVLHLCLNVMLIHATTDRMCRFESKSFDLLQTGNTLNSAQSNTLESSTINRGFNKFRSLGLGNQVGMGIHGDTHACDDVSTAYTSTVVSQTPLPTFLRERMIRSSRLTLHDLENSTMVDQFLMLAAMRINNSQSCACISKSLTMLQSSQKKSVLIYETLKYCNKTHFSQISKDSQTQFIKMISDIYKNQSLNINLFSLQCMQIAFQSQNKQIISTVYKDIENQPNIRQQIIFNAITVQTVTETQTQTQELHNFEPLINHLLRHYKLPTLYVTNLIHDLFLSKCIDFNDLKILHQIIHGCLNDQTIQLGSKNYNNILNAAKHGLINKKQSISVEMIVTLLQWLPDFNISQNVNKDDTFVELFARLNFKLQETKLLLVTHIIFDLFYNNSITIAKQILHKFQMINIDHINHKMSSNYLNLTIQIINYNKIMIGLSELLNLNPLLFTPNTQSYKNTLFQQINQQISFLTNINKGFNTELILDSIKQYLFYLKAVRGLKNIDFYKSDFTQKTSNIPNLNPPFWKKIFCCCQVF